jgi:predicted O-methyltransferase YrrM
MTQLAVRVAFKIRKMVRMLDPDEREFQRIWPLIDSVEGHLVPGQEQWLFNAARALPDGSNIVEIGSFKGRSTCCLAFGCRGSRKKIFAVDSFNGNDWDFPERDFLKEFQHNLERCGLSNFVEPTVGLSTAVAKTWKKPIHMLFVDGSHRYEDVLADFEGFFPHVADGGLVAFHDVVDTWPGVYEAWNNVLQHRLTDRGSCSTLAFGRKPASLAEASSNSSQAG